MGSSILAFDVTISPFLGSCPPILSLGKILAKQNISFKKADEIQVKINILKAFVEGPLDQDGKENARNTAEL